MRIRNTITVKWLETNPNDKFISLACFRGFKSDFGKSIKTRDLVQRLNKKNYNYHVEFYLCSLIPLLFPPDKVPEKISHCVSCEICMTAQQMRNFIYQQLKKQGD